MNRTNSTIWGNECPEPPAGYDEHDEKCQCFNCEIKKDRYCECGNEVENEGDQFCKSCEKEEENRD